MKKVKNKQTTKYTYFFKEMYENIENYGEKPNNTFPIGIFLQSNMDLKPPSNHVNLNSLNSVEVANVIALQSDLFWSERDGNCLAVAAACNPAAENV